MYEIGQAEIDAVAKVIRSGRLMRDFGGQGGWCERFEAALAGKVGVKYALTTCSGTTAELLNGTPLSRDVPSLFARFAVDAGSKRP